VYCITDEKKTDVDSEFLGTEIRLFQGKRLSPCSMLTEWVRWDEQLFRWYEVFWCLGLEYTEAKKYDSLSLEKLHELAHKYIGEKPMLEVLKEVDSYLFKNKDAYFYARCSNLSKKDTKCVHCGTTENLRLIESTLWCKKCRKNW
jgi:hypothetical protein